MKKISRLVALLMFFCVSVIISCSYGNETQPIVSSAPTKTVYTVSIADGIKNGTLHANPTSASAGTTITLTATPANGYYLSNISVTNDAGGFVQKNGDGESWTFEMPSNNVTVSATFSAVKTVAASGDYAPLDAGTGGSLGTKGSYVTFGLWPQTIKAAGVIVDEANCEKEDHGAFTYCKGNDNEWYVKNYEMAYENIYKYSDGTTVGQQGTRFKWFKVEPIKWRIITTEYDHDKNHSTANAKLLLAESILKGVQYFLNTNSASIGGKTIYASNYKYSTVRAYLNGIYETDDKRQAKTYLNKGFLQTAFTSEQQKAILITTIDNSADSTKDADGNLKASKYYCDDTSDKIFLLSEKEVTTTDYGFASYDRYVGDTNGTSTSTRIRITTDFTKADNVYQSMYAGQGGLWWLRSPHSGSSGDSYVHGVMGGGSSSAGYGIKDGGGGIVPALCVAN